MNANGQIFSLDALISLILVILAMGVIFGIMETNSYNLKEHQLFEELQIAGRTAADVLVASPDITCTLTDSSSTELYPITHCIDLAKINGIVHAQLGLSSEYKFKIERAGSLLGGENTSAQIPMIYSEKRTVFFYDSSNHPLTKQAWNACRIGNANCTLGQPEEITLSVWRG